MTTGVEGDTKRDKVEEMRWVQDLKDKTKREQKQFEDNDETQQVRIYRMKQKKQRVGLVD